MPAQPSLAVEELPLSETSRAAIRRWLEEPVYADTAALLGTTVERALGGGGASDEDRLAALAELEEAFSGPLPIGTGGRRGPCGAGPNRVNSALMRESAGGLVLALRRASEAPKVAIVYDSRASSRTFALVVAAALTADQIDVTLLDAPRPTPQLSYMARKLGCGAGVVISASHNPPTDNGIKMYGPDGAQVLGERDRLLMEAIIEMGEGTRELPPIDLEAIAAGTVPEGVTRIDPETQPELSDGPYHDYVRSQGVVRGSLAATGLRVVYSALHGVGDSSVIPVLRSRGVDVRVVEEQLPDGGEFKTIKSANPEWPPAFELGLGLARECEADLALATDPDADRVGAVVRDSTGEYRFIDGNRLGVLMLDHVLRNLASDSANDSQSEELEHGWVLTTLVSSPLIARLARTRGVEVVDDLLVGFKHHAGIQNDAEQRALAGGPPAPTVVFACEESHGYLRGNEVRDKDGAIAALLLAECAAQCKGEGADLFTRLEEIWSEHGYHREQTANIYARGPAGSRAIAAVMDRLRAQQPSGFAGLEVVSAVDRAAPRDTGWATRDLPGNVLVYELEGAGRGCRLVFRPSGTEPKIKVYALAHGRPGLSGEDAQQEQRTVDELITKVLEDAEARAREIMAPLLQPA